MTLVEKYQAFSSELLRLSLIGVAALGFFVEKISTSTVFAPWSRRLMFFAMGLSALGFALAAAAAIASRYYFTEVLYNRLQILQNQPPPAGIGDYADIRVRLRRFLFQNGWFKWPLNNY